mgnify:FL=1
MNIIKQYASALIALTLLAAIVAGFFGIRAYNESLREQGRAEIRAEAQAAENAALREDRREIARLVTINQGIQDAYNATDTKRQMAVAAAAESKRLRNRAEHDAAAAAATAGALIAHAGVSERNLAGLEDDANKMADRAVRATANSEALAATLRARREDIDTYRATLRTPSTTGETQ